MKALIRFSEKCYQKIDLKKMIIAVVIFLLFSAIIFPMAAGVQKAKTGTAQMPDTLMLAKSDAYYALAESYGSAGRAAYIWLRFTFDLAWPIVYGLALTAGLSYLLRKAKHAWVRRLNLLPVLGVVFDLAENTLAVIYMARYPMPTDWAVHVLPFVSALKWGVLMLSFALGLAMLIKTSIIRYRRL